MGVSTPTIRVISSMITIGGVNHMKDYSDWFDDNWKLNITPRTVFCELLFSPTFRLPMRVTVVYVYRNGYAFPCCPRCKSGMEYEYQFFCNRCGQRLNWRNFSHARAKYMEPQKTSNDVRSRQR